MAVRLPEKKNATEKSEETQNKTRLLFLAPTEAPIGGAASIVNAYADVFKADPSLDIRAINTSPPMNYRSAQRPLSNLVTNETVGRTARLLRQFAANIGWADVVLVFTNNYLAFALIPPMLAMAHLRGKPIYLKTIGGDLDLAIKRLKPPLRQYILGAFRQLDGILAETQLLQNELEAAGCTNVAYVPNCRSEMERAQGKAQTPPLPNTLHAVFISQVHEDKGVLVLLEALRRLEETNEVIVACDFYGPIFPAIEESFREQIDSLERAEYRGVLPLGDAPKVMAKYDVLVLPTHYVHEGHPGILIEAMQAGIAVIGTRHRAIPELVTHNHDGLLVPTRDAESLAEALTYLAQHPEEVVRMGAAHGDRLAEFSSERVVGEALDIILKQ